MAKTCFGCKKVSETGAGYRPLSSFSPEEYCRECLPKRQEKYGLPILLLCFAVAGAIMAAIAHFKPQDGFNWFGLNLYLFILAQALTTLPHELGHAYAARLAGMRVHSILVGRGPVLIKGRFLGGSFELHAVPYSGTTVMTDPREKGYKARMFLGVAGGPFVNLLLLGATLPYASLKGIWHDSTHGYQPLLAFALANALVLVSNLIPRKISVLGLKLDSDGLLLCKIPFLSPAEVRKQAAAHYLMEGVGCLNEKKYDEAIRWNQEGLRRYPEAVLLRNNIGVALLRKGDLAGGLEEFRVVAASSDVEPGMKALAQCNVAVGVLLLERADLLPESDQGTAEALKTLPEHPFIRSTRGAVLVELGKLDEGVQLVREGIAAQTDPGQKAVDSCILAMALRKKGDPAAGTLLLQQAEKLNPECLFLPRARRAFGLT